MIAAENRILWLPDTDYRMWDEDSGGRSASGVRITPENALSVSVVYACIRVLAESVAALPLHILERMDTGGKRKATELPLYRKLNLQPNGWQTSFEWRCQLMLHLGLYNVAYCEIVPGAAGAVESLEPLHPSRMKPERLENGRLRYKYREQSGQETIYTQDQILAIRGLSEDGITGVSPIESCRDAIALARACEIHGSKFFGNGARPGFILSTETQLNPEARENIRSQWDRQHGGAGNAYKTAVLTGGLKPFEIPQASNTDSQFLELRKFQIEEICRLYRVPQHKVQSMQGQSYGSLEQVSQDFLTDTLVPWLRRFESAFMRDLIVEDERYEVAFDTRAMLRADSATRTSMYTSLWNLGVYSTNDIRESEGLNAVEGGDVRYRPLNMGVLGEEAAPADAAAAQQPGSGIDGQAVAAATPAPAPAPAPAPIKPAARALAPSESRAMTISIDFDKTFSADPKLWGEFAMKSEAEGNTIVMISRRPDTLENQSEIADTIGEHLHAFSRIMLIGGDTLKADAAAAAGIKVDVWVDDAPLTIADCCTP